MAGFQEYLDKATDWALKNPAWVAGGAGLTAGTLAAMLSQKGNKFRNFLIGLATGGGASYLGLKGYGSYRDWKNRQNAQVPDNPEATPGTGRQGAEGNDDPYERYRRNADAQKATEDYMKAYNAKKYAPTREAIELYKSLDKTPGGYDRLFNLGYDPDTDEGRMKLQVLRDAVEAEQAMAAR